MHWYEREQKISTNECLFHLVQTKKNSPLTHGIDLHCFFIVNNACRSGSTTTATPTSAHEKKHNTKTNIQKQIAAERMQNIESSNRPK